MRSLILRKLVISLSSLLILFFSISVAYSHIGCVTDDGNNVGHLPQGQTVYYNFVGITDTQKTQVETAFSTWQTTNTTQNCSGVTFSEGTAPSGE